MSKLNVYASKLKKQEKKHTLFQRNDFITAETTSVFLIKQNIMNMHIHTSIFIKQDAPEDKNICNLVEMANSLFFTP